MEQLLADLRAAYARGTELIAEYQKKLGFVIEEKKRLDQIRESLDAKHHEIEAREAECQKVENIQKLHSDATDLHNTANLRSNAAGEAEKSLQQQRDLISQEIANKRELLRKEDLAVQKQKKTIDDEVKKRLQDILDKMGIKQ